MDYTNIWRYGMCAILGGNGEWDYNQGLNSMVHRGPDSQRVVSVKGFTLAFARLSIIDPSDNGMQPMMSEDKQVSIVFNGEVYGYKELRNELMVDFIFNSESDTEVLLNMYLKYGVAFVEKINGIFSFAILDSRERKLIICRDRFGIKPLYYYYQNGNFIFSSEIKGILNTYNDAILDIDYTALYDYLTYSYIPYPKSLYKYIRKLEPAHILVFDVEEREILSNSRYWELKPNEFEEERIDYPEAVYGLQSVVKKTMQDQLVADVPVGVMTSGGVDSSIVTYEASLINSNVETYTIKNMDKRMDESAYAELLTHFLNLQENIIPFRRKDFAAFYDLLPNLFDEPIADKSAILSYLLSKEARKKVKVLLSGDGADEVFGGYRWLFYLSSRQQYKYGREFSKLYEKKSSKLSHNSGILQNEMLDDEYLDDITWYCKKHGYMLARDKSVYRYKWGIPNDYDDYWFVRKYYNEELPPITRCQVVELNTYLPYILDKVDITGMAASIEIRVPFLDTRIVEYSFSLPQNVRVTNLRAKGLLKDAYNIIPYEILYREKMGFDISEDYYSYGKKSHEVMLKQLWGY